MQAKGTTALVVVTAVIVIAAIAVSAGGRQRAREARSGEPVLAEVRAHLGDVAALKITDVAGSVTLQRKGSGDALAWTLAEKGGYPADPAKIRQILLGFAELKLVEPKTSEAKLYTRLDVEDPGTDRGKDTSHARLVVIGDAAGKTLGELIVGKRRPDSLGSGADGLYIRRKGDAQSWLAQGSVDLPAETKDWLDKKVVSIPAARIESVTLTHADASILVLTRAKAEDKFAIDGAPADAKIKSEPTLAEPAGVLDGLELSDVRPAAEQQFPSDGVAHVEWKTFDGLDIIGETFEKDGTNWVRLKASGTGDAAVKEADAFNAKLTPWVYGVYPYKTNAMKTKLTDLIEPPKAS
jgi:hypothetical protein